jgi:hypothetical protein
MRFVGLETSAVGKWMDFLMASLSIWSLGRLKYIYIFLLKLYYIGLYFAAHISILFQLL